MRDWKDLYNNILSLIDSNETTHMKFWSNKWNGEVRTVQGEEWSVGKYTYKKNTVTVTELPYQESNCGWVEKIKQKPYVVSVDDKSTKLNINIIVKLKPNAFDQLKSTSSNFSSIEENLLLKKDEQTSKCVR